MPWDNPKLIEVLNRGGVAVMPTDTIYGLVGRADNPSTVERIYQLRQRAPEKPCIIIIGDIAELDKFSIKLTESQKDKMKKFWPGPVSIILDCPEEKFAYLHRGTKTLAFRVPGPETLRNFLVHAGPLVAPSANTEGQTPAKNIKEAYDYFANDVDMYLDGGEINGTPSKLIKLDVHGAVTVLRG